MRDRLIELIDEAINDEETSYSNIADYLLENGVIVPPCKVGDIVYVIEDWGYKQEIKEKEVGVIVIKGTNDFSKELWEDVYGGVICTFADFGKTVFLTKEEAEKYLGGVQE